MPRGFLTPPPFPSRISRDLDRARAMHTEWPRRFGLLTTTDAMARHCRGDYALLAACFNPAATGEDPLAGALLGIAAANRSDPILPRLLGGPIAVGVAAVSATALVVSLFVDTGKLTPGSPAALYLGLAPVFLWITASGVALSRSITGDQLQTDSIRG